MKQNGHEPTVERNGQHQTTRQDKGGRTDRPASVKQHHERRANDQAKRPEAVERERAQAARQTEKVIDSDPAESFRIFLEQFQIQWQKVMTHKVHWAHLAYDMKRSDSLVSPIQATVSFKASSLDGFEVGWYYDYRLTFAPSNGGWMLINGRKFLYPHPVPGGSVISSSRIFEAIRLANEETSK